MLVKKYSAVDRSGLAVEPGARSVDSSASGYLAGRFRTVFRATLLFSLLLVTLACMPSRGLLEPNNLPPEHIRSALVQTPSPVFRNGKDLIVIKTIDGQEPTFLETKAIVSPGRHRFQVEVELQRQDPEDPDSSYVVRADKTLEFSVDADGRYLIDAQGDGDELWIWAVDMRSKQTVAGEPPRQIDHNDPDRVDRIWGNSEK